MLLTVEANEDDTLNNLTMLRNFVEPSNCSIGDEEYYFDSGERLKLSYLLSTCTANLLLTAQVYDSMNYCTL